MPVRHRALPIDKSEAARPYFSFSYILSAPAPPLLSFTTHPPQLVELQAWFVQPSPSLPFTAPAWIPTAWDRAVEMWTVRGSKGQYEAVWGLMTQYETAPQRMSTLFFPDVVTIRIGTGLEHGQLLSWENEYQQHGKRH